MSTIHGHIYIYVLVGISTLNNILIYLPIVYGEISKMKNMHILHIK